MFMERLVVFGGIWWVQMLDWEDPTDFVIVHDIDVKGCSSWIFAGNSNYGIHTTKEGFGGSTCSTRVWGRRSWSIWLGVRNDANVWYVHAISTLVENGLARLLVAKPLHIGGWGAWLEVTNCDWLQIVETIRIERSKNWVIEQQDGSRWYGGS